MSLDIWLSAPPDIRCHHCGQSVDVTSLHSEGYSANITHNLTGMAEEAGLYGLLWRPEENDISTASQLIEPLTSGILAMKSDPSRFEKHNSPNGWGLYDNFLPWLERLLVACREFPNYEVRVSR